MSLKVTPLGHATVWIESGPLTLLTDPVFSERVLWIRRQSPFPFDPRSLPNPTAILISHAHYDHLDLPSFKYFSNKVPIILPTGLGRLLKKFLSNPLIELNAGTSYQLEGGLKIKTFPVSHWGFRIFPFRYTRCNGYLIEANGHRVFFPGDTAYRSDFARVSDGRPIDVALLPISCYEPAWFMRHRHINPLQAVQIFEEIGARYMVPIHWGTFKLSTEPLGEPIEWLKKIAEEKGLTDRIRILKPGESFEAHKRPVLSAVRTA